MRPPSQKVRPAPTPTGAKTLTDGGSGFNIDHVEDTIGGALVTTSRSPQRRQRYDGRCQPIQPYPRQGDLLQRRLGTDLVPTPDAQQPARSTPTGKLIQNNPAIASAILPGTNGGVDWMFDSLPSHTYRLESSARPTTTSRYRESKPYGGAVSRTTDQRGRAVHTVAVTRPASDQLDSRGRDRACPANPLSKATVSSNSTAEFCAYQTVS